MITFFSKIKFIIPKEEKSRALHIINENYIDFRSISISSSDELIVVPKRFKIKKLEELLINNHITYNKIIKQGILSFVYNNKHRIGFLLGIMILIISSIISSKYVWQIEIYGNNTTTNSEIIENLNKSGFSLGSYIPNINYEDLHNKFLLNSDTLSWVSINIKGNVASVMVREKIKGLEDENTNKYANIVAKEDGQIQLINIIDGKKKVSIGDIVKKGDLLISGIMDSKTEGVKYVRAKGNVMAYVNKKININVPLKAEKKIYKNEKKEDTSYIFFKKYIKLNKNNTQSGELYDIIEKTEHVYLFNKIKLPVQKVTKTYIPYEYEEISYSYEEAIDLGIKNLNSQISLLEKEVTIISKNIKTSYINEIIYIDCDLYCIEDISSSLEFYVNKK